MSAEIRAVRAAERQLRGFPPAVAAILGAEAIAARFAPALEWAAAAPLEALSASAASGAEREAPAEARPRGASPEPGRSGSDGGGVAEVAGGALAGVRRAVEGIGELVAGGVAAAGANLEPARRAGGARAAEGIGAALAGGARPTLAEAIAGSAGARGGAEAQPVFSLGAIGRRAAAALAPERVARGGGGAPEGEVARGLAAALGGGASPEAGAVAAAVGGGVGVAALRAAGAAATVVEALVPAMVGISRRIEATAARAASMRDAAAAAAAVPGAGGERSSLAAMAAAATRAMTDLAPAELASTRPPTLEGQIETAPAAPPATAARGTGAAPQVVDAEWVVAVVGDALLEQARRQGIDLT